MGFGQFLQGQGLSPDVTARLQTIYDTPDGAPDPDGAPTAEEMARYGAKPAEIAVAQRANGAPPGQSIASPMQNPEFAKRVGDAEPKAKGAWTTSDLEAPPAGAAPAEQGAPAPRAASQGTYVPGGWHPSSETEQRVKGTDPTKLEEGRYFRDVAQGHGLMAADKRMEAAQMQGAADAAYAAAHQQAAQQALEEQQRIDDERKKYIADEHAKLNDMTVKAQKQVDPEAAKGSSGAQLMAAIGIALGQYGASITGGPNAALQIVQSNIDRNIKAQEANIANAGKSLDAERSLYHQNLEAFGDRDRAVAATKIQMLDQAKAIADQQYANAKGAVNEADYHATVQGLNEAKAQAADQFTARTEDKVTTESRNAYSPGGVVGPSHEAKGEAHGYSEELEKAGIPQALAGLQEVDSRLDALGSGDVAGIGPVKNHLPSIVLSDEGVANRQAVAHIKNALRKSVAGASLTPGEKVELDKDLEGAGDAASLRNFVHSYRRTLSNQQKNIEAGHTPEGVGLYEQRGGSVKRVDMGKRTAPLQKPVKDDEK